MPDTTLVPGFPQDMAMTMDEAVEKPETFGLRKGWTAGMMGMMTLIRVVSPALFEQIAERRRAQREGRMKGPLTLLLMLAAGAASAQTPTRYTLADLERLAPRVASCAANAAAATAGATATPSRPARG